MNNNLDKFIKRLKKAGFELELIGNFPFTYIYKINNKPIKEKFISDHGFLLGYMPIKTGDPFRFSDSKEIFKLIRKYK